uniref:Uncharacterized protein n=1 Tax=Spongospora subterranea TaxID=70186 RepID=A0A0H5RCL6_9EUKA|eukprot:CRZ11322.1 hypothetical protein [Spongospora subterranea]
MADLSEEWGNACDLQPNIDGTWANVTDNGAVGDWSLDRNWVPAEIDLGATDEDSGDSISMEEDEEILDAEDHAGWSRVRYNWVTQGIVPNRTKEDHVGTRMDRSLSSLKQMAVILGNSWHYLRSYMSDESASTISDRESPPSPPSPPAYIQAFYSRKHAYGRRRK